jgi:hypothetical protein
MPNWRTGIIESEGDRPCFNALVFATKEEAEAYGSELLSRWTLPVAHVAVETNNAVTYRFDFERGKAVPLEESNA